MNTKDLKGLMEAYSEVYAPQEVDEAVKGADPEMRKAASAERRGGDKRLSPSTGKGYAAHAMQQAAYVDKKTKGKHIPGYAYAEEVEQVDEASSRDEFTRAAIARSSGRKGGITFEPGPNWDPSANRGKGAHLSPKQKEKQRRKALRQEELDIFDVVLEFLQVEGYAETLEEAEWMMANIIDEEAIEIITELTGGKGHPGYKAGSKDHGPMQSGHPADTFKRTMKGGTMSQRHGDHLGDLDDDDDDDDGLEAALKDTARKKRENVRKPLRNKVKAARKVLSKEEFASWLDEAMTNYEKNRKRAAMRAAMRNDARAQGKTGAVPGVGYVTPRKERETWTDESGKTRHAKGL